jgi:hypothetical protein
MNFEEANIGDSYYSQKYQQVVVITNKTSSSIEIKIKENKRNRYYTNWITDFDFNKFFEKRGIA